MSTELQDNKVRYLDVTNRLNDYNEIYNLNQYLQQSQTSEYQTLNNKNEETKMTVMKLKQKYMMKESDIYFLRMRTYAIISVLHVVALLCILYVTYLDGTFGIVTIGLIVVCLITAYLLLLYLWMTGVLNRRKESADHVYWSSYSSKA